MNEYVQEKRKAAEDLLKQYYQLKNRAKYEADEGKREELAKGQKECRTELKRACSDLVEAAGFAGAPVRCSGMVDETAREIIRQYFIRFTPGKPGAVKASGIRSYLARVTEGGVLSDRMIYTILFNGNAPEGWLLNLLTREDETLTSVSRFLRRVHEKTGLNTKYLIRDACIGYGDFMQDHALRIGRSFTEKTILSLLEKNPLLKNGAAAYGKEERKRNRIKNGLLDAMPETYPDLFPLARQKERHFILHIGPTNSGKS